MFALALHLAWKQGDAEAGTAKAFRLGQQPPPVRPELPDPAWHRLDQLQERFSRTAFFLHLPHSRPAWGSRHRLFGFELRRPVAGPAGLPPLTEPEAGNRANNHAGHLGAVGGKPFVRNP